MKKKTKTRPWALAGGREPETNGNDRSTRAPSGRARSACTASRSRRASGFVNLTAGGGGYGDPLDREPGAVVADVLDGYVSVEAGEQVYGVAVAPDGSFELTPARRRRSG